VIRYEDFAFLPGEALTEMEAGVWRVDLTRIRLEDLPRLAQAKVIFFDQHGTPVIDIDFNALPAKQFFLTFEGVRPNPVHYENSSILPGQLKLLWGKVGDAQWLPFARTMAGITSGQDEILDGAVRNYRTLTQKSSPD